MSYAHGDLVGPERLRIMDNAVEDVRTHAGKLQRPDEKIYLHRLNPFTVEVGVIPSRPDLLEQIKKIAFRMFPAPITRLEDGLYWATFCI